LKHPKSSVLTEPSLLISKEGMDMTENIPRAEAILWVCQINGAHGRILMMPGGGLSYQVRGNVSEQWRTANGPQINKISDSFEEARIHKPPGNRRIAAYCVGIGWVAGTYLKLTPDGRLHNVGLDSGSGGAYWSETANYVLELEIAQAAGLQVVESIEQAPSAKEPIT
jgi:hypothetical protein